MPRLLLDTHVFLWWVTDDAHLTSTACQAIADADNTCYLSLVSCWELAIKSSLGKLRLIKPVGQFVVEQLAANAFTLLPFELRHAAKTEKLPLHHPDPFDRLLIVQAMAEKMTTVTAEQIFAKYGAKTLW